MSHEINLNDVQRKWHGSLKAYLIGFFGSLILTILSFSLSLIESWDRVYLMIGFITLALIQALIQLVFFLHVGKDEDKPRFASLTLVFAVIVLLVIVIGSIWIMNDLNERMMPTMMEMHEHGGHSHD